MSRKVALVTGANKGIGFEIARLLLVNHHFHVIVAGRSADRVQEAIGKLQQLSPNVSPAVIDLDQPATATKAVAELQAQFGQIDVLVNNAGMAFKSAATEPFGQQALETMRANYHGTVAVTQALLPLVRNPGGRIVNVSSRAGNLAKLSVEKRGKLEDPTLTTEALSAELDDFVRLAASNAHRDAGWPDTAYGTTKIGVTLYTRILAREHPGLSVTACCPGWCRTDMAGQSAPRTAEEGADTPVWLATTEEPVQSGQFYAERARVEF